MVGRDLGGAAATVAIEIRRRAGIEAKLISETRIMPGENDGFILGYSGFDIQELAMAAERLGRSAEEIIGRRTSAQ